ncbi:MAG: putative repeat protein (TIGR01451 family) [Glaciecola sp.]|jgi:uncharacterized repeat protein (TIGR01451 family)
MKRILLSLALLISINSFAQLNASGDGFKLDFLDASSQCLVDVGLPNNGNVMAWGETFVDNVACLTSNGLELQSVVSFESLNWNHAIWFPFPAVEGSGESANCTSLFNTNREINLSSQGTGFLEIDLIASVDNAEFKVYLGGVGQWSPVTSTYNTGSGLGIDGTITTGSANQLRTYYVNFEGSDPNLWNSWAGRNKIQSLGFRSGTPGALFTVKAVRVGTEGKLTPDSCNFLRADFELVQGLDCQNSSATIKAKGYRGTEDYTFNWQDGLTMVNDSTVQVDTGGFYTLIVSDVNCADTVSVYVAPRPDQSPNLVEAFFFDREFRTGFTRPNSFLSMNRGCESTDGEVYFVLDSLVKYELGGGDPSRISGDTLFWTFTNLSFGNPDFSSTVNLNTSVFAAIGDTVCFELGVKSSRNFVQDTLVKKYFCLPIINGYDPNDIAVHPSSCDKGYVLNEDILTYKIRFQNTGNAEAININVLDTLNANLDPSSFELISSSHPNILKTFLLNDSVIHFAFDEIWLKDSLNHEPESHGYVVFQVKQKSNLAEGTAITNKADIYFDYNPAVVTNTVLSTVTADVPICNPRITGLADETSSLTSAIYPNPNNGTFTVSFDEVISSGKLDVYNIEGGLVDSQLINNANTVVVSKKLHSGVYFIEVYSNEGISNSRFVVK